MVSSMKLHRRNTRQNGSGESVGDGRLGRQLRRWWRQLAAHGQCQRGQLMSAGQKARADPFIHMRRLDPCALLAGMKKPTEVGS